MVKEKKLRHIIAFNKLPLKVNNLSLLEKTNLRAC